MIRFWFITVFENYKEIWNKLNLDNEVELDSKSIAA